MNALLLALSVAGWEGTLDAPATLASELSDVAPRAMLNAAPFPLRMSLVDAEAPVENPLPKLQPAVSPMLCVAFVLPSFAELTNAAPLQSPVVFDGLSTRPWLNAGPDKAQEPMIPWLKDWNQR